MLAEFKPYYTLVLPPTLEKRERLFGEKEEKREEEGCSSKLDSRVFLQNFKERKEEDRPAFPAAWRWIFILIFKAFVRFKLTQGRFLTLDVLLAVSCHGSFGPLI
ncbi:hypothetical protein FNV43_RR07353 [Rhamnella rubrinervis]|uniref:Uncharacterized protein n=1 Tax=Rhamnella rubrinervis TaxID=2594499 RepID=A0A8K0HGF6_9ROSA|nr:hypothetical protein FNV43_RR07353 [Rhamnella rubrinervis]